MKDARCFFHEYEFRIKNRIRRKSNKQSKRCIRKDRCAVKKERRKEKAERPSYTNRNSKIRTEQEERGTNNRSGDGLEKKGLL